MNESENPFKDSNDVLDRCWRWIIYYSWHGQGHFEILQNLAKEVICLQITLERVKNHLKDARDGKHYTTEELVDECLDALELVVGQGMGEVE